MEDLRHEESAGASVFAPGSNSEAEAEDNTLNDLFLDIFTASESSYLPQQQPNCEASETPHQDTSATDSGAFLEPSRFLALERASSSCNVANARSDAGLGSRSRSRSGGDDDERASSELVLQLQKLCKRQRQRSDERAFVRDVERMLALLRIQTPAPPPEVTSATFPGPGLSLEMLRSLQRDNNAKKRTFATSSRSSSDKLKACSMTPTLAEINALLDCIADLFDHRNFEVRALAFEVVQLVLQRFGERLTPALRRKIYLRLETHSPGDFLLRQNALRALTQDGRHLEPFHVELGWFLLRLLEQSDAQRDLLELIQSILRRSPQSLDRDKVIAIVSVISARCEMAWCRKDLDACHKFVAFFHVLASHDLAYAATTPACLRSLCCLVNADGHGTWSVMKLLLNGHLGFFVLRGLVQVLEHPTGANSPWVLRGAVFFIGMSCWGSQRVAKFDDIAWAPLLLALERALQCCRGVVIFEVILSIQRLIKKFGAAHPTVNGGQNTSSSMTMSAKSFLQLGESKNEMSDASIACSSGSGGGSDKRCLIMEWDIILRMLHALRPWVSMTNETEIEKTPQQTMRPEPDVTRSLTLHPTEDLSCPPQYGPSVSIQHTRIPHELLDTLQAVEDLVDQQQFAGDVEEFLNILEDYLPHLSENSMLFLLRQRAEAAHPGYHLNWLTTLSIAMRTFFSGIQSDGDALSVPSAVRLEALEVLRVNLLTSRNVCEDRVIEEVVIPTLGRVYEDLDAEVRRQALEFIIEVTRQLESVKFDALLDILTSAVTLSSNDDAQLVAISGIVSLFSSAFDHLPPARATRMYDFLATTVESHRNRAVREIALSCLLCVCEARVTDGRLQWKEQQQIRTSRFLFVSRRAARVNATGIQLTAACVPVARVFRALLTLVSAEPDAHLFRMAVEGIKTMLENRAILEDVDVNDVASKVVASINYRAFGRAAIADEVDRMLRDEMNKPNATHDATSVCRDQKMQEGYRSAGELVSQTDAELVRSIHASTRPSTSSDSEVVFCSSMRATIVLLVKIRFLSMGIDVLQHLVSYGLELRDHALHDITRCLVGAMKVRLVVAEKDLLTSGSAVNESTLSSFSSAPDMLYCHDTTESPVNVANTYASGTTPLGFTSRVLSRFQTSASHGNLFHALSGSMSKSAFNSSSTSSSTSRSRPSRKDRAQLQHFLRQLYDSEFKLRHTTTTALSLLVLLSPALVLGQLDEVVRNLRGCITTVDGDFRTDAFVAMLELLESITPLLHAGQDSRVRSACKAITEAILLGFEYAKSKQLSYLAFRLLCQVVYLSDCSERVHLAALAMPTLQQCTHRANSLLAEAAIDFLICHAYSQSASTPSAIPQSEWTGIEKAGSRQPRSRSWYYKRSLVTISTYSHGKASLIIRRANCTSNWELNTCPHSLSRFSSCQFNLHREGIFEYSNSDRGSEQRVESQSAVESTRAPIEFPDDHRRSRFDPSHSHVNCASQKAPNSNDKEMSSCGAERIVRGCGKVTRDNSRGQGQAEESTLQQTAVLPPLPAYDGIGGSPSYFCENAQVSHRSRRLGSLASRNKSRYYQQAEGDDSHEDSSSNRGIGAIHEGVEENDDAEYQQELVREGEDENEMDAFSLDDSLSNAPSVSAVTSMTHQFGTSSSCISTEATARDPPTLNDQLDPKYLMMQLFDLTVENRPQLLSDGPALELALSVLDRTPEFETHKIGLLYVRNENQSSESTILGTVGGSLRYLRFLRRLGSFIKLKGFTGYSGGLDTVNDSDGKFGLIYKDSCCQIIFHVATMMVSESNSSESTHLGATTFAAMKKKRHIGNDFVHVVFKECDEEYDLKSLSGQFNDVHIIIQPLNDHEYRSEVHVKPGIPPFGPLYGRQIIPDSILAESVRLTCLNANLACQVFHQDLVGFALNCEERLKQIKQLGLRLVRMDN